jgi:hypothetical protein
MVDRFPIDEWSMIQTVLQIVGLNDLMQFDQSRDKDEQSHEKKPFKYLKGKKFVWKLFFWIPIVT